MLITATFTRQLSWDQGIFYQIIKNLEKTYEQLLTLFLEVLVTFMCTTIAGNYTISISFFTALSLAGNDLIILQMNHGINLFHKHYLQVLIKTIKAKQSVQIKKFACLN